VLDGERFKGKRKKRLVAGIGRRRGFRRKVLLLFFRASSTTNTKSNTCPSPKLWEY
jgi:hypothetical protein